MKKALVLLVVVLTTPALADACADLERTSGLVVLDITDHADEATANRTFSFHEAPGLVDDMKVLIANTDAAGALAKAATLARQTSNRFISARGDHVNVICFFDEQPCSIAFKEARRKTRLATDLQELFKLAKEIRKKSAEESGVLAECRVYTLTEERSLLTITAARADAEDEEENVRTQIVTGPIEHWYLSADIPVNDVKLLEYDKESRTLVTRNDPTSFYVGVNFKTGDLWRDEPALWRNLVVKGFVKASSKPLESYGVALGLRGQYLRRLGLDLDLFSPFVGWTSSLEDAGTSESPEENARRKTALRFGISFNIDKALTWIQSSGDPSG